MLWILLIVPMLLVLLIYKSLFEIWDDTLYLLTGLLLAINLVVQAMIKYTQGIILMEKDMVTLVVSSVIGGAKFYNFSVVFSLATISIVVISIMY